MGETSSDSDSGSGPESDADTDSQLEPLAGTEIPSKKPSSLSSQENSSVTQKAQVNLEPTSSRESETNLALKGKQKTVSNESVNYEQPVRKQKVPRSLRDFLYEPIYSSWYRNENSNIIILILNELGVKTNYIYVMKLLFAAAEIISRLDQGEGVFFSKRNQFYNEYIKDNSSRPTPTLEKFDDYLYRWAETVWLHSRRNSQAILEETF